MRAGILLPQTGASATRENALYIAASNHKYSTKIKVCFLTASEFNYRAFKDVFSDLKENQFIQKLIANKELIKIVNGIISST